MIHGRDDPLETVAELSVSNISSKGERVKISVMGNGRDVKEDGEDGSEVDCELLNNSKGVETQ